MKTKLVSENSDDALELAVQNLRTGSLVAFPTDTVYGLGCLASNTVAIDRLYRVKERSPNKAIAVLIAELADLNTLTTYVPPLAASLAERFWPGALTLIFPRHPQLPANLSTLPTIGIRMPDHTFAHNLLRETGPLATTSANISGQYNPANAQEVLAQLDGRIELIVDGGATTGGIPSTVVDCTQSVPKIIRIGAFTPEELGLSPI